MFKGEGFLHLKVGSFVSLIVYGLRAKSSIINGFYEFIKRGFKKSIHTFN